MKKLFSILPLFALLIVSSGCGLSVWQDMMAARGNRVMIGGGAYPGADYVTGLKPSLAAKQYFAQVPDNAEPLETVHRKDAGRSKSGVQFLANGGILIPPGVVISYENKGCCMDPSLPAPKEGDEYQLVPVERLLPAEMRDIYQKLMLKAANGDQAVQCNLQYLVWALRTAGTDHPIANSLSKNELSILDRCGYSGQFSAFHQNAKANKDLNDLANALVSIGTVSYSADDLRNSGNALERINEHLEQLMQIGATMPTSHTGFNFGELEPGIYTDIRGTGYLTFTARIANSTGQDFIFYPSNYAGQVGSGVADRGMAFFATANDGKKQRVTAVISEQVKVDAEKKSEGDVEKEDTCPPHRFVKNNSGKLKKIQEKYNIKSDDIRRKMEEAYSSMSDRQLRDKIEYGGLVYFNPEDNELHTTSIRTSGESNAFVPQTARKDVPDGAIVVGIWHTHGRTPPAWYSGENLGDFSLSHADIAASHDYGWHISMMDFDGYVHHYDPILQEYFPVKQIRKATYQRSWWDKQGTPNENSRRKYRTKMKLQGENPYFCIKCHKIIQPLIALLQFYGAIPPNLY